MVTQGNRPCTVTVTDLVFVSHVTDAVNSQASK